MVSPIVQSVLLFQQLYLRNMIEKALELEPEFLKKLRFVNLIASLNLVFLVVPRIIQIVLAFMELRALPADAFQGVKWTQYVSHFAG